MTTVTSADLVPELQHWFYQFVVNSIVNRYGVPAPADVDSNCVDYQTQDSFIELLFNENYDGTVYHYLYTADTSKSNWTYSVMTRLNLYPGAATYYRLAQNDSGQNVFNLQSSDLTMLDALLAYRTDGTSVSIVTIDATSTLSFDSTALVLYANYDSIPTELSKLIYLYLDLKLYGRYSNYNNLNTVSTSEPLETMYELLLIDEYFKFMSARDIDVSLQC
jgi:hypothetical protein